MWPLGEWAKHQKRATDAWKRAWHTAAIPPTWVAVPAAFTSEETARLTFYRHLYNTGRLTP